MKAPPKDERSCCVDMGSRGYKRYLGLIHLHHAAVGEEEVFVLSPPGGLLQSHCVMMAAFFGSSDEVALEKLNSLSAQCVR